MATLLKRLDHAIASLAHARNLMSEHDTYDFDLRTLPVTETAITALVDEIEEEVKEIRR